MSNKSVYDKTLNLPKTSFPMKANLTNREPEFYKKMNDSNFYNSLILKNEKKPVYILHDGPPYANGSIHLGTALNKILKDFVVKQKNMSGFKAPFVPGWDTHGLPIELKALKSSNVDRHNLTPIELRNICENYAKKYVELQKQQFQSLGVIADFEHPYLTCDKKFESKQIEVFAEMAKNGHIYKGLKPVYYCCQCSTALAESEIEYFEDECESIYVKFKLDDDGGFFAKKNFDKNKIYFLIWTTTTWTLPANVAICLGANFNYCLVSANGEFYIVAENLVEPTMKIAEIDEFKIVDSFKGSQLENFSVFHPLFNRKSTVILGNHVTLESGTGCVHTAPGHGVEDFEVCKKYKNIPMFVVVDENGKMNNQAEKFCGLTLNEANSKIIDDLKQSSNLFAIQKLTHSYPHCWRCKEPVLFRATEQWFCSIEGFKEAAINSLKNVRWEPFWGENRMEKMISDRSDWCISRQRVWGVPIPAFYCVDCGFCVLNENLIKNVAEIFEEFGSNAWFEQPTENFTKGYKCEKCGSTNFKKETDIMDVWFDSGCSHAAVLNSNFNLSWPADLYLEGADQYRGWFQSSLLTSIATTQKPPYKCVCTHGWVVDGEGRKMSKSLANGVAPEKIVEKYGAEILRLWVSSSNYHDDIRISENILKQVTETYRKIRNTARFMLANLNDFDPNVDFVNIENLTELDKYILFKLNSLIENVDMAYSMFEFFVIYQIVHKFCVVDLSNFYLDIIKDRLYCDVKNGFSRRATQTTLFILINSLTKIIAPILSFTAEEIWSFMPHKKDDDLNSVFYNEMDKKVDLNFDELFVDKWNLIEKLRNFVQKALENEREKKIIGSSLEAKIVFYCKNNDDLYNKLNQFNDENFKSLFLVSEIEVNKDNFQSDINYYEFDNLNIGVLKATGNRCERCWSYDVSVGSELKHKTLCKRCYDVVENFYDEAN